MRTYMVTFTVRVHIPALTSEAALDMSADMLEECGIDEFIDNVEVVEEAQA